MKFPVFALFERSLRLETRSALMSWSRVGLMAVILVVLLPIQSGARAGFLGAPGLNFLEDMAWVNLVFITLAGLSYFASAITEEKEEMMLGLLRMTDLNGVTILLGKSTSRLIGALLLLLVQVPFVLLAVTLGGVGVIQIVAAYATLLAYLFLLCNLALVFSVIFRNTATAAAVTFFLLLLFFIGHYFAKGIMESMGVFYHLNLERGASAMIVKTIELWREATPSERLETIFRTGFNGPIVDFQIKSNLIAGVIFFLLAWLVFDPCTRTEKEAAPARRWLWRRATSRPSRIPRGLVGFQAITWKDFVFMSGGGMGLILKFMVVGLLVGVCNLIAVETGGKMDQESEGYALIWISLIVTAIWLALEASRIFKDEVRWKTLSSLVILPISMPELAYRKVLGVLAGTLPLLACFVVGFLLVPNGVSDFLSSLSRNPMSLWALVVTVLQFVLFLHLTAFLSLVLKRGALAVAFAIQYILGMIFLQFMTMFFFAIGHPAARSFITSFICVVLTVILHWAIGFRLARAAAEE